MSYQENYALAKFGIDEIYIHAELTGDLLEKLNQRAAFSIDGDNPVVRKCATQSMILIFHNRIPSQSVIYRFLEFHEKDINKESFIESNTLINVEELFLAITSKKFVLITNRILLKAIYSPTL